MISDFWIHSFFLLRRARLNSPEPHPGLQNSSECGGGGDPMCGFRSFRPHWSPLLSKICLPTPTYQFCGLKCLKDETSNELGLALEDIKMYCE